MTGSIGGIAGYNPYGLYAQQSFQNASMNPAMSFPSAGIETDLSNASALINGMVDSATPQISAPAYGAATAGMWPGMGTPYPGYPGAAPSQNQQLDTALFDGTGQELHYMDDGHVATYNHLTLKYINGTFYVGTMPLQQLLNQPVSLSKDGITLMVNGNPVVSAKEGPAVIKSPDYTATVNGGPAFDRSTGNPYVVTKDPDTGKLLVYSGGKAYCPDGKNQLAVGPDNTFTDKDGQVVTVAPVNQSTAPAVTIGGVPVQAQSQDRTIRAVANGQPLGLNGVPIVARQDPKTKAWNVVYKSTGDPVMDGKTPVTVDNDRNVIGANGQPYAPNGQKLYADAAPVATDDKTMGLSTENPTDILQATVSFLQQQGDANNNPYFDTTGNLGSKGISKDKFILAAVRSGIVKSASAGAAENPKIMTDDKTAMDVYNNLSPTDKDVIESIYTNAVNVEWDRQFKWPWSQQPPNVIPNMDSLQDLLTKHYDSAGNYTP